MTDTTALVSLLLWPVIPLFWVPVHCKPAFFRRLGLYTYVVPAALWIPVAIALFASRHLLLAYHMTMPFAVNGVGLVTFLAGAALQVWTLRLLTAPVITGMPEVTDRVKTAIMAKGPFTVIRHPTYLSHTMMLLGLFLWTGVVALGVVTLLDALIVNVAIIPLEERELLNRFGKEYEDYRKQVRHRILPLPPYR